MRRCGAEEQVIMLVIGVMMLGSFVVCLMELFDTPSF
jgi:hypothetical protein